MWTEQKVKVLKGASNILKSNKLRQIYIELDDNNMNLIEHLNSFGFEKNGDLVIEALRKYSLLNLLNKF